MKSLLISFLFFLIFIGILSISIFGVLTPENTSNRHVYSMEFSVFKNGLSLYQNTSQEFYTISPFNDYFLDKNNNRNSLISANDATHNNYTSSYNAPKFIQISETVKSYLGITNPAISFKAKNSIEYSSLVQDHKLTVTRKVSLISNNTAVKLGTTLSFYAQDFIFDSSGNLYNYVSDKNIAAFERFYSIPLKSNLDNLRPQISGKTLFIYNPSIATTLVITASKNQEIFVNRNAKLIEIEETINPQNNSYTNSIQIYVYDNPREVGKSI